MPLNMEGGRRTSFGQLCGQIISGIRRTKIISAMIQHPSHHDFSMVLRYVFDGFCTWNQRDKLLVITDEKALRFMPALGSMGKQL